MPLINPAPIATLRYTVGTVGSDGRPLPGAASVISPVPMMSVQPAVGRDIVKRLPEGTRLDMWRVVYSDTLLIATDQDTQIQGDLLTIGGLFYQVEMTDNWMAGLIPHCFALVKRHFGEVGV